MGISGKQSRSKPSPAVSSQGPCIEPASQMPVFIAAEESGCDYPLHLPAAQSLEHAQSIIAREAMRWTYVLRSRRRWVNEAGTREQNESAARDALLQIGIDEEKLKQLAAGGRAVVRIPWTGNEQQHWESRILPWEYFLSAATRRYRLNDSFDGKPRPFTVMRELLLPPRDTAEPPPQDDSFNGGIRALIVECLPPELREQWNFTSEYERLTKTLPVAEWKLLSWPTPQELKEKIADMQPQFVHFAGMDSHQGMRELRRHIGSEARVTVENNGPLHARKSTESAKNDLPNGVYRIDDLTADGTALLDGILLRGNPHGIPAAPAPDNTSAAMEGKATSMVRTYPQFITAHGLALLLAQGGHCACFASFNLWNSAARIAPLVVAERGARAAIGFQDVFDDGLAEYLHSLMYEQILHSKGNIAQAFEKMWKTVREQPESVDATGITLWASAPLLERHATTCASEKGILALPETTGNTVPDAGVRVNIKSFSELNYAVLHNARPLFEHFVLECSAPNSGINVDVDVSLNMGMETARYQQRICMNKHRLTLTDDIHIPLTAALIRSTQEALSSSLVVEVSQEGRVLYRNSHRLRLLPVDQWRDNAHDGRWLPSFVQPRDPAVPRVLEIAQRYVRVLRDDPSSGFEGYQLANTLKEDSLRNVDRQVESIWAALLHDWNLGYVNPPPSYSATLDSQRLRSPSSVWNHHSGTCIDLALLFAACLEYVDIHPVVFLLEGHALPGWWRHSDFRHEYLEMPQAQSLEVVQMSATENPMANAQTVAWHTGKASWPEIQRWIRQRKLVPIETVRLTERGGFVDAIESGVAALAERSDFDSMVEITTARHQGVTPLPVKEH